MWSRWQARTQGYCCSTTFISQEGGGGGHKLRGVKLSRQRQRITAREQQQTEVRMKERKWVSKQIGRSVKEVGDKRAKKRGTKRKACRKRSGCVCKMQTKEQCCFDLTLPVNSYVNGPQRIYVEVINIILVSNSGHVNSTSRVNSCKLVKWFSFISMQSSDQSHPM